MNDIEDIRHQKSISKVSRFLSYLKANSFRFPSLYSKKYFTWKISENPFGNSFCNLRNVDGIPVAHASITAKPINTTLCLGSVCAELGDTHTHPNYQKQGHFGAVGMKVINQFDSENNNEPFIFGIPNQNAVHGWQSRCNCGLLDSIDLFELSLKKIIKVWAKKKCKIIKIERDNEIRDFIDEIWSKSYKKEVSLYKKDSSWWSWRYNKCPENYEYFGIYSDDKEPRAYLIAKFTNKFFLRYIDICDIVGVNEDSEIELLNDFLSQTQKSLSMIKIWSTKSSLMYPWLINNGFRINRKINFVLYKNKAYKKYCDNFVKFDISLGDTDNV